MKRQLDIRYFAHSWVSDWNHGNAHFLRGLARELVKMGHQVRCYEGLGSWSLTNLLRNEGDRAIRAIDEFREAFPELDVQFYEPKGRLIEFLTQELRHADVVIFHEWNDPAVVAAALAARERLGFRLLFHDTHHRAYTDLASILKMQMHLFDGVIAYGEVIRKIYGEKLGVSRTWTMHEAADVSRFHPLESPKKMDVLWVGNWGDDERTQELNEFLVEPAKSLGCNCVAFGVRYPEDARRLLQAAGIEFRGYLPNLQTPSVYAEAALSVHIPRRLYANGLSGIPTIRMFEAMACGATLVCSPWMDTENLFRSGEDYISVQSGDEMKCILARLLRDEDRRREMGNNALRTIRQRHTCAHRAEQLTSICEELLQ